MIQNLHDRYACEKNVGIMDCFLSHAEFTLRFATNQTWGPWTFAIKYQNYSTVNVKFVLGVSVAESDAEVAVTPTV
jgi:hypothetical protein